MNADEDVSDNVCKQRHGLLLLVGIVIAAEKLVLKGGPVVVENAK